MPFSRHSLRMAVFFVSFARCGVAIYIIYIAKMDKGTKRIFAGGQKTQK